MQGPGRPITSKGFLVRDRKPWLETCHTQNLAALSEGRMFLFSSECCSWDVSCRESLRWGAQKQEGRSMCEWLGLCLAGKGVRSGTHNPVAANHWHHGSKKESLKTGLEATAIVGAWHNKP